MSKYQIEVYYQDKIDLITAVKHEITDNYLFIVNTSQETVIPLSKVIKIVIYYRE